MAVKKKAELGPKATLMKKNVDQLKRQAKKLKVQNYSTKKKEQLVNSIMMAEARAKRKPGTKRKKAAPKASAVKSVSTRVTMKGSGMKRMVKKRGAMPNRVMKNPARNATRRPNKPMMAEYNGWPNYETWLMNLWYGDYFYSYVSEGIEDGWIDLETSRDPYELGNMLKDHVEELIESEGQVPSSGFVADLFNGAMRDINWYSIGDSLISEL
jgi:hypothetical protein